MAVSAFAAGPVPDFLLQDVNVRSNREGRTVSPRDYLYQVAGFYFATASTRDVQRLEAVRSTPQGCLPNARAPVAAQTKRLAHSRGQAGRLIARVLEKQRQTRAFPHAVDGCCLGPLGAFRR